MKVAWWVTPLVLFGVGFALLLCAIIVPFKIEENIDDTLVGNFLFDKPEGKAYDRWVTNENDDSARGWVQVYIFNTTNSDQVSCCAAKPKLERVGPFYFNQYLRNVNATFSDLNEERVVTSTPYIYVLFNRSLSVSDLNVSVTLPQMGYWGVLGNYTVRNTPQIYQPLTTVLLPMTTPYITQSVQNWLFGYDDFVLTIVNQVNPGMISTTRPMLFRNHTSEEDAYAQVKTSTVSCGYPNAARFQQMILWKDSDTIPFWDPPLPVTGSPGNYFGFRLEGQEETLVHFVNFLSRSLLMNHSSTTEFRGIRTYRYRFDPKEWYNMTNNPSNAQFYQYRWNGLLNITAINQIPVFISKTNFLGADTEILFAQDGLQAPSSDDEPYIDIEPLTGAGIVSYKPVQINLLFGNFVINFTNGGGVNIPNLFVHPMTQLYVSSEISDAQTTDLRDAIEFYENALVAEDVVLYGGAIIGSLLIVLSTWLTHHRREELRKQSESHQLLGDEPPAEGQVDLTYGSDK
jgi:lysosome membrane protein 2